MQWFALRVAYAKLQKYQGSGEPSVDKVLDLLRILAVQVVCNSCRCRGPCVGGQLAALLPGLLTHYCTMAACWLRCGSIDSWTVTQLSVLVGLLSIDAGNREWHRLIAHARHAGAALCRPGWSRSFDGQARAHHLQVGASAPATRP